MLFPFNVTKVSISYFLIDNVRISLILRLRVFFDVFERVISL